MMMMMEKEDLGLSLSLSFVENRTDPMQLNLIPSLASSTTHSPSTFNLIHNTSWTDSFPSDPNYSETCRAMETRTFLKEIDVNRVVDTDEEAGVSSPNSTISSLSGNKRNEREAIYYEDNIIEMERACSRGGIINSEEEDGETCRKKLRLTKEQSIILEESFKEHSALNPIQKLALAKRLGLRPRQVEVWFQNRRARTKLKQTEVYCEFMKRCVENLTEENRRLQKKVQELREIKLSPQFYMQMTPPTTLTMCPSCERVASSPINTPVNVGSHKVCPAQQQPMPFNLWATTSPISQGQFCQMDSYSILRRQK